MKNTTANVIRERYLSAIMSYFTDEDIGRIASNSFNFPIVEDGEEGWIEIVVKIPKDDEGYAKREEYTMKCKKKIDDAKAKAETKAKKIERDKKMREEKKRAKQEKDVLGTTLCTYCGSNERKVYNQEPEVTDFANANEYYKTYCPKCGREGSVLKQSFIERSEQKGE